MTPLYVAHQLGHSLAVLLSTYAHPIAEREESDRLRLNVGIQPVDLRLREAADGEHADGLRLQPRVHDVRRAAELAWHDAEQRPRAHELRGGLFGNGDIDCILGLVVWLRSSIRGAGAAEI